jgi:hypothetical protein
VITFYSAFDDQPIPYDPDREVTGYIPSFFDADDPRSAREQVDSAYQHGGGWRPYSGFKYTPRALYHPGDPPMTLRAHAQLRDEQLRLYRSAWLAIVQLDGSVEIARVD